MPKPRKVGFSIGDNPLKVSDERFGPIWPQPAGIDHELAFFGLRQYIAYEAYNASARLAYSWRQFRVGAALYAVRTKTDQGAIFVGGNYKPREDFTPKICAERVALTKADEAGYDRAIGFVVCGPLQNEQVRRHSETLMRQTLPPCDECQVMFEESPAVSPDTYVLTVFGRDFWSDLKSVYELNAPAHTA